MPMIGRRFTPGLKRAAWGSMQSGDFPVPVLHLKFGKNTGTVAYDSSPNGYNGVIEGASWVKGYLGPGLDFDSLDDYVRVNEAILTAATKVTIEMIINIPVQARQWNVILGNSGDGVSLYFSSYGPTGLYGAIGDTTDGWIINHPDLTGAWNRLTMLADAEDGYIHSYLNGVLYTSVDASFSTITLDDLYIGSPVGGGGRCLDGIIDELIIWEDILTARQILQRHQGYM